MRRLLALVTFGLAMGVSVCRGEAIPVAADGAVGESKPTPVEAVFRVRAGDDRVFIRALEHPAPADADPKAKVKPVLECSLVRGGHRLNVQALSAGEPMATTTISDRTWSQRDKINGNLAYEWRYPAIKNLWDDTDRRDIGAAYDALVPFGEKTFVVRMVLTGKTRQIWLDDRLVAEDRTASPAQVQFIVQNGKTSQVLDADFRKADDHGRFTPLNLTRWSHLKSAQEVGAPFATTTMVVGENVPMRYPQQPGTQPDIDLSQSLFRYRMTHGSGPDTGYVNALSCWSAAFDVDPARLTFRVPYRDYQNVWLLAWVDKKDPNAIPRGALRFFREKAGYPAITEFEISDDAIAKGLVKKLGGPGSEELFLIRVPVDTNGLYGLRDLSDQFLDFELTKPLSLMRSYPDPIYYGWHPAGPSSSIHVAAITLEEAPFGYEVKPAQTGHVFERPEKPSYTIAVTNTSDKPLDARATLSTRSFDGSEQGGGKSSATIAPGKSGDVKVEFDVQTLGWHELKIDVEAGGVTRSNTMALVLLPPNTRTYGEARNETRFGTWHLWGHYIPPNAGAFEKNEKYLAMYRRLGLRRISMHESFVNVEMLKRQNLLPTGPHTVINVVYRWKDADAAARKKIIGEELAAVERMAKHFSSPSYFYGGEWHVGTGIQYSPWPLYTGDGDRELTEDEKKNADLHIEIFTTIGRAIREKYPQAKLVLQWGAPLGTIAYLRSGIPKDIVDEFGMDQPQFEVLPEISNATAAVSNLWMLNQEAERAGFGKRPIRWCEGPFFPTQPTSLTETEQAEYQVRYWLQALANGVDQIESAVVPHDAGNYYAAEHYGAGVFHRLPLEHPKPAVAALATATSMMCGADPVGGVPTGCLTNFCMAFERSSDKSKVFALWRVDGTVAAKLKVRGSEPMLTDSMGNVTKLPAQDGAISFTLSSMPVWLIGVEEIESFTFDAPKYDTAPAKVVRPLAEMKAEQWAYDGAEDAHYDHNHFGVRRIVDPNLKAEFGQGEDNHPDAVAITLAEEPMDRPMAIRYGAIKPTKPIEIPGKAAALGLWVKGNSSWGRVVYELRDTKGEIWTSVGTKNDWNCDDAHCWSYVKFEGWRYVRFPLPGNHPWDQSRELETTWWGSRGGDGVVDLPLALDKIIVEARNEVPYLGKMTLVPERSYKLAGLVAEYAASGDASPEAIAGNQLKRPMPEWVGPTENPIAHLTEHGERASPQIKEFVEPHHFNDGRRMHVRFDEDSSLKYNLYLSRYPDGRGAELLRAGVTDNLLVAGLRPEVEAYLFLTSVSADKKESKPSPAFKLITHDRFAEK